MPAASLWAHRRPEGSGSTLLPLLCSPHSTELKRNFFLMRSTQPWHASHSLDFLICPRLRGPPGLVIHQKPQRLVWSLSAPRRPSRQVLLRLPHVSRSFSFLPAVCLFIWPPGASSCPISLLLFMAKLLRRVVCTCTFSHSSLKKKICFENDV